MSEAMDTENRNSYKQSLKATSLFGGVQIFNILIQIIRSKFAAVLLGPEGMGVMGLLNSTITMISSFTNCGLGTSAVRNIAEANGANDTKRIALIISVFRRLVWITGLTGALICLVSASLLSQVTFGNTDYFCFYNTFILGFIDAINFRAKCFNAGDAEVSLFGEGQCSWQCSRFNIYHTVILFLEDRCYCPCFIVFECFDFYPVLYICPQNKD